MLSWIGRLILMIWPQHSFSNDRIQCILWMTSKYPKDGRKIVFITGKISKECKANCHYHQYGSTDGERGVSIAIDFTIWRIFPSDMFIVVEEEDYVQMQNSLWLTHKQQECNTKGSEMTVYLEEQWSWARHGAWTWCRGWNAWKRDVDNVAEWDIVIWWRPT